MESARSGGWWKTATYILGENEAALQAVCGALRGIASGDATQLDPLRLVSVPKAILRPALQQGQVLSMAAKDSIAGHPLGRSHDILGTCLHSQELAIQINLPQREIPGIPVRERSDFALTVPPETPQSLRLGWVQDPTGRDLAPYHLPAEAINRHAFVTGITGSRKTNTCMQILLQAEERLQIPFLVVEPAKTEYRALRNVPGFRGRLRVLSIGGVQPLRLNPMLPVPGIPLGRHIDLLKAIFNASFPMFAGMAYVLEEALHEAYLERGWNLYDSSNSYLPPDCSSEEQTVLIPTLQDVHDKIEEVLNKKHYGKEIHQNLGAALRSRLHSLTVGQKGMVLNTRRSLPPEDLFGQPTIIELQELADDEEKAFVMALLFILLYEYAEARQHHVRPELREQLQHLTLIEEANRLLQAPRLGASAETGDPRGKAVNMFTDMLAEMRALGEGFLVADQIPTKMAPEILKNSNVKIVHRLVAPDDRLAAGGCLNLTERQCRDLNNLTQGRALVHDERSGEAFLLRVEPFKKTRIPLPDVEEMPDQEDTFNRNYLYRHGGCRRCPNPCQFFHRLDRRFQSEELRRSQEMFFAALLAQDEDSCWQSWNTWRSRLDHLLPKEPRERQGGLYCAVAQAVHSWLLSQFSAREQVGPGRPLSPSSRIACDFLAKELSSSIQVWIRAESRGGEFRDALVATWAALGRALFQAPPQESPGCRDCPCRCQLLTFVAPHLSRLSKVVDQVLFSQQPWKMRWSMLEQALPNPVRIPLGKSPRVQHWAYCLVANAPLTNSTEEQRQALLSELR